MLKKKIGSLLMAAAAFAFAGTASANVEINIYGASAQYEFWKEQAFNYLNSTQNVSGAACSNVGRANLDSSNEVAKGTCGSYGQVLIRYSSKASYDGILSLRPDAVKYPYPAYAQDCQPGDQGYPGSALAPYYRLMTNENCCTWGNPGSCLAANCPGENLKKCVPVTIGASDVAGVSFPQESHGQINGPAGGGWLDRTFSTVGTQGLDYYNPLVIPFAFYVNNSVEKCSNYSPATHGNAPGTCTGTWNTISNVSREMVEMIYSGQALYWKDFGDDYQVNGDASHTVVACMRHAGSGTHATLDYAIMKGNGWGWPLLTTELTPAGTTNYFNDGTSQMLNCVKNATGLSTPGALGYADADRAAPAGTTRIQYQGADPNRPNIRNGRYDFWTKLWLFEDPNPPTGLYAMTHSWVKSLVNFSLNPDRLPGTKADFWATSCEMVYMKTTDQTYPGYVGAGSANLGQYPAPLLVCPANSQQYP